MDKNCIDLVFSISI